MSPFHATHTLVFVILSGLCYPGCTAEAPEHESDKRDPKASTRKAPPESTPKGPTKEAVQASPLPFEACADCHPDEVEAFLRTGMGQSFYKPSTAKVIEDFTPKAATVRHSRMGASYRAYVDPQGRWWQEESIPGTEYRRSVQVQYIIGSGNHSRSYLGLVNGDLIQLPLTWYSQKGLWDMSPGYEGAGHLRFLRTIVPECLFCHNGLTPHNRHTSAQYEAPLALGIDCARCHGDGTEHSKQRSAGQSPPPNTPDPWILNPRHLPERRAVQICQQCHLQGTVRLLQPGQRWDTYDPKRPLTDLATIFGFPRTGGQFEVASHSERLSRSKCKTKTGDALRCTSCHNPHGKKTTDVRAVCASCHGPNHCKDPIGVEPGADCTQCHMQKGEVQDVPHVTFTDHLIARRIPKGRVKTPLTQAQRLKRILKPINPGSPTPSSDLRTAHADVLYSLVGAGDRLRLPSAYERLKRALATHPQAFEAYETLGKAAMELRLLEDAVGAFKHLETRTPERVLYREPYAQALLDLGQPDRAIKVLLPAVTARADYGIAWGLLGVAYSTAGQFGQARKALTRAAALMPEDSTVQYSLGMNALAQGQPRTALQHWKQAEALDPLNATATIEIARYLRFNGKIQEARVTLERLKTLRPYAAQLHLELARIAVAQGRLEDAYRLYSIELRYNPTIPEGYIERAQLLLQQDDRAEARQSIKAGRLSMPGFPHWDRVEADLFGDGQPPPAKPSPPTK